MPFQVAFLGQCQIEDFGYCVSGLEMKLRVNLGQGGYCIGAKSGKVCGRALSGKYACRTDNIGTLLRIWHHMLIWDRQGKANSLWNWCSLSLGSFWDLERAPCYMLTWPSTPYKDRKRRDSNYSVLRPQSFPLWFPPFFNFPIYWLILSVLGVLQIKQEKLKCHYIYISVSRIVFMRLTGIQV